MRKIKTSITDKKLRDKQMKEKDLNVPKVVEHVQQNTYDRKNKKNTIPEGLTFNWEKDIQEKAIHKMTNTGQYGTRSKETPRLKLQILGRLNWNPNHKCPGRDVICHKCQKKGHFAKACRFEKQKRQEFKKTTETVETEESDTDKSIKIVTEVKLLTERGKIL